jgi:FkbM family methyltransferase
MIKYLKDSFKRKIARRFTKEYPSIISTYNIKNIGEVEFANWSNPFQSPIPLDENMIEFFNQFIKPGDLIIDIGAHIGDTTVPMSLCSGAQGLAIGFDPNPYVFKILEKNASLNKDKTNIVPINFPISQKEEEFYYISSEASFCNGGISLTTKSKHGKFIYPQKIKGVNLKNFLDENYKVWLAKLSFIKIDTEGFDKEILKSIKDLIIFYKPIIVAESFCKANNADKLDLYDTIDKLGYEIHYFEDFSIHSKIKKSMLREEILNYKNTINVLALPK